jgi:spermidine/putrescine transport system substrate-binding protein
VLNPEHAADNVSWFGYPMPIKGTEAAFAELAANDPAIEISTEDLEHGQQFRELTPAGKLAWDRIWTEVKA